MRRLIAAVSVTLFVGSTAAFAQAGDCSPHCDFYHNYGPYDFSYIRVDRVPCLRPARQLFSIPSILRFWPAGRANYDPYVG